MKYSSSVGVVVGCIIFWCIGTLILMEVSKYQAEPYMDEIFHIAQAQKFCVGRYNEVNNTVTTWNINLHIRYIPAITDTLRFFYTNANSGRM